MYVPERNELLLSVEASEPGDLEAVYAAAHLLVATIDEVVSHAHDESEIGRTILLSYLQVFFADSQRFNRLVTPPLLEQAATLAHLPRPRPPVMGLVYESYLEAACKIDLQIHVAKTISEMIKGDASVHLSRFCELVSWMKKYSSELSNLNVCLKTELRILSADRSTPPAMGTQVAQTNPDVAYTAETLPAQYRDSGKPAGEPLVHPYLEDHPDWRLSKNNLVTATRNNVACVEVVIQGKRKKAYEFKSLAAFHRTRTLKEVDDDNEGH